MDVFRDRVDEYALSSEEIEQLTDEQRNSYQQNLDHIKKLERDFFVMKNSVRIAKKLNKGFEQQLNNSKKHRKIVDFMNVGIWVMTIVYFFAFFFCGV